MIKINSQLSRSCLQIPRIKRFHSTQKQNVQSQSTVNLSIATKQQLYMIDENSPGSIFFLPHGARIFNKLVTFMKLQQKKQGFNEVITPLIFKKKLWETSGHWENYHEDMFKVEGNDITKLDQDELNTTYGLKPMNCPGHCIIYSRFARSHNELPIRLSDWSSLHRNEASGALTGLTRVRRFHQDDGHIFCTKDQVGEEISKTIQLIKLCYNVFGFGNSFKMMLSTRPESHIGTIEEWDQAETQLTNVLNESIGTDGSWFIREGDGAFYGPKIDVLLTDNFGKEHQVATIQLDFQLPQRFELEYQSDTGSLETPIMIHRAIFGSVERFLSLLIDHYDGKWPFWLSPRQAVIIPINSSHVEYSQELRKTLSNELDKDDFNVATKLTGYNFIVDVDDRTETVGFRTKDAIAKGYNYIIMIGDKEVENGQVAIRSRDNRKVELKTAQQVLQQFIDLEDSYK